MDAKEIQEKMYKGFEITCQKCGGQRVIFENTLGYSEMSGEWGDISLECTDCNNGVIVYEP